MKKYKLIKYYPSLPNNYVIGIEVELSDDKKSYRRCGASIVEPVIYYNEVENFPEFWKEVKSPLAITEDGVEIWSPEHNIFAVNTIVYSIWETKFSNLSLNIGLVIFYNKHNAEKWIKANKKIYFKKGDVVKVIKSGYNANTCCSISENLPSLGVYSLINWDVQEYVIEGEFKPITFEHDDKIYGAYPVLYNGEKIGYVYNSALEKVLEKVKDYKIITFNDGFNYYYKKENGKFTINLQYEYDEKGLLESKSNKIIRVKRLSDNQIFNVGDIVKNPKLKSNETFKINGFCFDCNNDKLLALGGNGAISINKIEIYDTSDLINITYDGVQLNIGDSIITVNSNDMEIDIEITFETGCNSKNAMDCGYLWFSTKEKAIEYIDNNKLLYTKNDLISFAQIFAACDYNDIEKEFIYWEKQNENS